MKNADNSAQEPVVWSTVSRSAVLYRDPNGRFEVRRSIIEGATFIHTDVLKKAPSTIREIDRLYPTLRRMLPDVIYAFSGPTEEPVFRHFVTRYGWEDTGHDLPVFDGEEEATRRVYRSVKG